ncbi:MAG: DUF1549 and DUF1553 domain-containing protein [Planctomycetota bacterium]|nr:DUF1549 and DUF1553 domain-containing protein [Planctomycetota bacterium]
MKGNDVYLMSPRLSCVLVLLAGIYSGNSLADDDRYTDEERAHWSFRPRMQVGVPVVDSSIEEAWVRTPIDAFVANRFAARNLAPAPAASSAVLTRRLFFQLTGLPPSQQDLQSVQQDLSPDRYGRLTDRLLASPRYGERWAQHWLDVIRFAETEGFEYDRYRSGAWRFRDYVIRSFNEDKPFDVFSLEQLAGDELSAENDSDRYRYQVAAGFHRLGPIRRNAGNPEVAFSRNEVLTEMTDIIGASFLGLTVGCARCHDHMFDPIRQRDYYQLQAFLAATHEHDVVLATQEERGNHRRRTAEIEEQIEQLNKRLVDADVEKKKGLQSALDTLKARLPRPLPLISSMQNDMQKRSPIHVLDRGLEDKPGEVVGMRVLAVFLPDQTPSLAPDTRQPKTQLARWITDPGHPLTARVITNRLWQYHFGQGLVRTANDFGANGDKPSHPQLLDFLANELVRRGWEIKQLHRMLVSSRVFRQSSRFSQTEKSHRVDPDNRWLARYARRRLQAEELRDAMLSVSGRLHHAGGGPSVIAEVDQELIELLYKPTQWAVSKSSADQARRSIYLIAKRNLRLPFMEVFDQPDLQTSCARREASTHAPQVLEMLNGRLTNTLAKAFASRIIAEAGSSHSQQVRCAFLLAIGREPNSDEQRAAERFLGQGTLQEFALAMFNLNGFIYVD